MKTTLAVQTTEIVEMIETVEDGTDKMIVATDTMIVATEMNVMIAVIRAAEIIGITEVVQRGGIQIVQGVAAEIVFHPGVVVAVAPIS